MAGELSVPFPSSSVASSCSANTDCTTYRVGWNRGLGYAHGPDNPRFREFRRLFQQFIGPRACQDANILAMQEEETHRLMLRFLRDPENFYRHPREYVNRGRRTVDVLNYRISGRRAR